MVQAVLTAPPVWEPVDLGAIARGVVQSARVTYGERFDLSIPGPARVLGQLVQLDRALSNLIENAAHVGHGRVRVEVRTVGGQVRVGVDDDGPGLLHAPGGVSLGLLIVDRVVREHGGQVVVEDSDLGGTRVEMGFPAADRAGHRGGLRLVLCDDHRLFVESLAVVLQERGWEVLAVVESRTPQCGRLPRIARTSAFWTRCSTVTPRRRWRRPARCGRPRRPPGSSC